GIHQSMDLCMRVLSDPGDLAWVEDPCYWGARNLLAASGLRIRPIRVDAQGICPTEEDMREVPRFIFVTPSHQYPMGMVMSLARREMLLDYARKHGCWIIEDDYDSEFRYAGRPLPSLQGMDQDERVLYLGTFSKTMFPGLRLGYLVVPRHLAAPFVTGMEELYRSGQTPLQATMHQFMAQGHFESHIRRMRLLYGNRLDALRQSIGKHGAALPLRIAGSDAGLHLTLLLPSGADDTGIARDALAEGIVVRPLSHYFHDRASALPGLVLGYACVDEPEIDPAFEVLSRVIARHVGQPAAQAERASPGDPARA
ncbi:MAG TPA: PLP-dependent aminotransferase family protein, partial [Telluria sp.]